MDPNKNKVLNPLSIIFLFFSFTEVMLGYAVFNTSGSIQTALTVFVIAFPTFAAGAFFFFLWYRPQHLYAPKDYGSDESYLKSMAEARQERVGLVRLEAEIEKVITAKLTSHELITRLEAGKAEDVRDVLRDTASELSSSIREQQFFTVDFTPFVPRLGALTLPVDGFSTFTDLRDEIWVKLRGLVRPYYYGVDWVLRDATTGRVIANTRMLAGGEPGRPYADPRTLADVGIRANMTLEVVKPTSSDAAA